MSFRNTLAFSIVIAVVSAVLYSFYWQTFALVIYGNLIQILALLLAAISTAHAASIAGKKSKGWAAFAGGIWVWVLAQGLEALSEILLNQTAYGTVADCFWILGLCLMLIGLLQIQREIGWAAGIASLAGIFLAIYFILLFLFVRPHLFDAGRSAADKLLDLAYPTFNLAVSFCCAHLSMAQRSESNGDSQKAWLFFAISFLLCGILDVRWSTFDEASSIAYRFQDVLYFVDFSLLTLGGSLLAEWAEKALREHRGAETKHT